MKHLVPQIVHRLDADNRKQKRGQEHDILFDFIVLVEGNLVGDVQHDVVDHVDNGANELGPQRLDANESTSRLQT